MHKYLERARTNEEAVLLACASFGFLTTQQAGAWVWHEYGKATQRAQATRVLKRLRNHGCVLDRRDQRGRAAWVLTTRGAWQAELHDRRRGAHAGYDLETLAAAAWQPALFERLLHEHREGTITVGRAGLRAGCYGVTNVEGLDGLIIRPDETVGVVVVRSAHEDTVDRVRKLRRSWTVELVGPGPIVRAIDGLLYTS